MVNAAKPADVADLEGQYAIIRHNTIQHKSLDFSNVGMPEATIGGARLGGERHLRQYHQTRIFVYQFGGMLAHGAATGISTHLISANLPESLNYKIGSKWGAPLSGLNNLGFNAAMQLISGSNLGQHLHFNELGLASGVHRATTLKIWNGSEPLGLQIKIPVIDDNFNTSDAAGGISTNLTEALEYLGSLCLPIGSTGTGFYVPPPSPLSGSLSAFGQTLTFGTTYGRIMVQLGGIMLIDNCIIKGISVNYPKTKTLIKHTYFSNLTGASGDTYLAPLLAEVTIDIETIEAMTSNTYSKMLWLRQQAGMGSMNADLGEAIGRVGNFVGGAATAIGNDVKNIVT